MTQEKNDIVINDPVVQLGYDGTDLLGNIFYNGDIGDNEPQEICLDEEKKEIRILFDNNHEEIIDQLSDENIENIDRMTQEFDANKKMYFGFYQVDAEGNQMNKNYDVDLKVIPKSQP